jgi:hypothetical protein
VNAAEQNLDPRHAGTRLAEWGDPGSWAEFLSQTGEPATTRSPAFSIDPQSVVVHRAELLEIVRGQPLAEAAVEGFSDWQVVAAMERLWAAATELP